MVNPTIYSCRYAQVDVYEENDTSHVVTSHFFVRFPDTVLDTVTRPVKQERYFYDSTAVIVYDTVHGMDIVDRYMLIDGKPVRRRE